jgi:hypothetical protein
VKWEAAILRIVPVHTALTAGFALVFAVIGAAAGESTYERAFPQSKAAVEKILGQMQGSLSGRLPVLDGFAVSFDQPLSRYRRGYFQASAHVTATPAGGSIVRVNAVVTAQYSDLTDSRTQYQSLPSNGRLETDILDELSEKLAAISPTSAPKSDDGSDGFQPKGEASGKAPGNSSSVMAAQTPHSLASTSLSPFSLPPSLPLPARTSGSTPPHKKIDIKQSGLQAELEQLEQLLNNQTHPKNLVAVRKSGTNVVDSPSLNAKTLFSASQHDEFEMLGFNQDWVHVRISGLSRGWIWRDDLEMPNGISDTQSGPAPTTAADLFQVTRDETTPFPGDWEPLRGKQVRIISVQESDQGAPSDRPRMKLEFAKFVFDQKYSELVQKSTNVAGIALIFDSSDGGIIATTSSALAKWKVGGLSDAALWHECFFDPPEPTVASVPPLSQ